MHLQSQSKRNASNSANHNIPASLKRSANRKYLHFNGGDGQGCIRVAGAGLEIEKNDHCFEKKFNEVRIWEASLMKRAESWNGGKNFL